MYLVYFDHQDITSIAVAFIGALALLAGVVCAAVLPLLLSIRKNAKASAIQLKNGHSTNLREENDERHSETRAFQAEMLRLQRAQGRRIGRVDRRLTNLAARVGVVEEATLPREEIRKRIKK